MAEFPLADHGLAQRLEEINAARLTGFVQSAIALHPAGTPQPPVLLTVGKSASAWIEPGSIVNRCTGLGLHGPVTGEALDEIEEFFNQRGAPSRLLVCPFADESLFGLVRQRAYRLERFEQMFFVRLSPDYQASLPEGVTVEALEAARVDEWLDALGIPAGSPERFFSRCNVLGGLMFRVAVDGQPAGGGAIYLDGDGATLGAAEVLPAYRRRGAHAALLQARLHAAARLGVRLVSMGCEPGAVSGRNAVRAGFSLAYTNLYMVRDERPG